MDLQFPCPENKGGSTDTAADRFYHTLEAV